MNAHSTSKFSWRQDLVATAVLLSTALLLAFGFAASTARLTQNDRGESEATERRFENAVPEHVPIKARLKSEKSFKDLRNKNWARELEIEVRNTGSKPIYYLYVVIVMPDVVVGGHPLSMRTTYGRKELGLPETPVEPDDVPILQPGESLTVKLPEKQVRAYEQTRDGEGRPDPKTVEFEVQAVKFGDGTSFRGRAGKPWKEETEKPSPQAPRAEPSPEGCKEAGGRKHPDPFGVALPNNSGKRA